MYPSIYKSQECVKKNLKQRCCKEFDGENLQVDHHSSEQGVLSRSEEDQENF